MCRPKILPWWVGTQSHHQGFRLGGAALAPRFFVLFLWHWAEFAQRKRDRDRSDSIIVALLGGDRSSLCIPSSERSARAAQIGGRVWAPRAGASEAGQLPVLPKSRFLVSRDILLILNPQPRLRFLPFPSFGFTPWFPPPFRGPDEGRLLPPPLVRGPHAARTDTPSPSGQFPRGRLPAALRPHSTRSSKSQSSSGLPSPEVGVVAAVSRSRAWSANTVSAVQMWGILQGSGFAALERVCACKEPPSVGGRGASRVSVESRLFSVRLFW